MPKDGPRVLTRPFLVRSATLDVGQHLVTTPFVLDEVSKFPDRPRVFWMASFSLPGMNGKGPHMAGPFVPWRRPPFRGAKVTQED